MKAITLAAVVAVAIAAPAASAVACGSNYFMHIGDTFASTTSGGWVLCEGPKRSDSPCFPIDRLNLTHAQVDAMHLILDTMGRERTRASSATFDDILYRDYMNYIQPGSC